MSTLTLSRVMMPCDWIGIVTMRSDTRRSRSTTGMMRISPGPRGPSWSFPSRNWTPRSYCLMTRIAAASSATAAAATSTTMSGAALILGRNRASDARPASSRRLLRGRLLRGRLLRGRLLRGRLLPGRRLLRRRQHGGEIAANRLLELRGVAACVLDQALDVGGHVAPPAAQVTTDIRGRILRVLERALQALERPRHLGSGAVRRRCDPASCRWRTCACSLSAWRSPRRRFTADATAQRTVAHRGFPAPRRAALSSTRWRANHAPASRATSSSAPGSSNRCVAPGTIASSLRRSQLARPPRG